MIDIRSARNDPERFRAALARRGAAEAFDELMDGDARWRELVPQVDVLRA
jgi:seryl-tRNA synthetase